jgi:hypothetical protein
MAISPSSSKKPSASNIVSRQLGWLHYILYATPDYLKRFGEPKDDVGPSHASVPAAVRQGIPASELAARSGSLGRDPAQRDGDRHRHSAHGGMRLRGRHCCRLPSYVSEFEDRVVPLLGIKPLASVKVLAELHRARSQSRGQPARSFTGSGPASIRWPKPRPPAQMVRCYLPGRDA